MDFFFLMISKRDKNPLNRIEIPKHLVQICFRWGKLQQLPVMYVCDQDEKNTVVNLSTLLLNLLIFQTLLVTLFFFKTTTSDKSSNSIYNQTCVKLSNATQQRSQQLRVHRLLHISSK